MMNNLQRWSITAQFFNRCETVEYKLLPLATPIDEKRNYSRTNVLRNFPRTNFSFKIINKFSSVINSVSIVL